MNVDKVSQILQNGGIAVIPTDTIYGLVASVQHPAAVTKVYKIRQRDINKPCIILIGDISDLEYFDISPKNQRLAQSHWPGPVSIVLPCPSKKWRYLHRGTETLAFRVPDNEELQSLLVQCGPLIAPSANPEGSDPATNVAEAKKYFGDVVDIYIDAGDKKAQASKVIRIKSGVTEVLRDR